MLGTPSKPTSYRLLANSFTVSVRQENNTEFARDDRQIRIKVDWTGHVNIDESSLYDLTVDEATELFLDIGLVEWQRVDADGDSELFLTERAQAMYGPLLHATSGGWRAWHLDE